MASKRNPQTMAKRAREQAVKERRDRKRERKVEASAARAAGRGERSGDPGDDGHSPAPVEPEPPPDLKR
jgi:hypothetical protein